MISIAFKKTKKYKEGGRALVKTRPAVRREVWRPTVTNDRLSEKSTAEGCVEAAKAVAC